MKVFVIHKDGEPLMPCHPAKARILLKNKEAKIVRMVPFTIQLLKDSGKEVKETTLGIDPGETFGISVTTKDEVLFEAKVKHRDEEIKKLLVARREVRRTRRGRKTRYRKARFLNRVHNKREWIAPSLRTMLQTYESIFNLLKKILPISKVVIEYSSFDIQKLKNPDIEGEEYQNGEQKGSWNTREYILYRDNHTCQHCKGKSNDVILEVHHIIPRKEGGSDRPDNLLTLCKTCHENHHKGKINLKVKKLSNSYDMSTKMNILKDRLMNLLYNMFGINNVSKTYGYITKTNRIENKLPKNHHIDARMISGNLLTENNDKVYIFQKVRRHNRKIYKDKIKKGSKKQLNQGAYTIKNFHRYDIIKYDSKILYINGLRKTGNFMYKSLSDKTFVTNKTCNKIKLIQHRGGFIIE